MAISKQAFYEGAALYLLVRHAAIHNIEYTPPFLDLNLQFRVYLKYSAKGRSPWGFTFTRDEWTMLQSHGGKRLIIALICGSDGVAAITQKEFRVVIGQPRSSGHISCYRKHGEHYLIKGPLGKLPGKVAPSRWHLLIGGHIETS